MSDSSEDRLADYAANMAVPANGYSGAAGIQPAAAPEEKLNSNPEKTISCTSCRRRKLKCDRLKPMCGTCHRLKHECSYPERRRNNASKRRNMKDLEARLGECFATLRLEESG